MTLSRKFDELRIELMRSKITQGELAIMLKKCDGYVSQRITGKKPFTSDDIFKMASILKIPRGERWLDVFLPQ